MYTRYCLNILRLSLHRRFAGSDSLVCVGSVVCRLQNGDIQVGRQRVIYRGRCVIRVFHRHGIRVGGRSRVILYHAHAVASDHETIEFQYQHFGVFDTRQEIDARVHVPVHRIDVEHFQAHVHRWHVRHGHLHTRRRRVFSCAQKPNIYPVFMYTCYMYLGYIYIYIYIMTLGKGGKSPVGST